MNDSQKIFNRRKHRRYLADDGVYAFICEDAPRLGQIRNICRGGLVFDHIRMEDGPEDSCLMNILSNEGKRIIRDIPFRIVSEEIINNASFFRVISMRRLTVAFGEMTSEQRGQLNRLLLEQKAVPDRRIHPRHSRKVLIYYQDRRTGVPHDAEMYNYSDGGLCFGADSPLAPDAVVSMALRDPACSAESSLPDARVIWIKENRGPLAEYEYEFGVEYDTPMHLSFSQKSCEP